MAGAEADSRGAAAEGWVAQERLAEGWRAGNECEGAKGGWVHSMLQGRPGDAALPPLYATPVAKPWHWRAKEQDRTLLVRGSEPEEKDCD